MQIKNGAAAAAAVVVFVAALSSVTLWSQASRPSDTASRPSGTPEYRKVTQAEVDQMAKEISNWGRWGKDDQMGTLNLVTPAKKKQAAALVREGVSVSVARRAEFVNDGDITNPYSMVFDHGGTNEHIMVSTHGQGSTHYDALSHHLVNAELGSTPPNNRMYNGFEVQLPLASVGVKGFRKLDIYQNHDGVFTRGILYDIPRLKGVKYLEPGTPIYTEDLEAWERKAGVKAGPGDAILIRAGRWAARAERGPYLTGRSGPGTAGLHPTVLRWMKQRDIAVMANESGGYLVPAAPEGMKYAVDMGGNGPYAAVHDVGIAALGLHVVDICDFERLAEEAAKRNRWEFLFTVAPLPIPGAGGSVVNPIVIF